MVAPVTHPFALAGPRWAFASRSHCTQVLWRNAEQSGAGLAVDELGRRWIRRDPRKRGVYDLLDELCELVAGQVTELVVPLKCGMTTSSVVPSGKCHVVRGVEIRANTQRRLQLALVCIVGSLDGRYLLSAFFRYACVGSSSGDNCVRYVQPSGDKVMVGSLSVRNSRVLIA